MSQCTTLDCAKELRSSLDQFIADLPNPPDAAKLRRLMQELESCLMSSDEHAHRLKSGIHDVVAMKFLLDNNILSLIPQTKPGVSFQELAGMVGVDAEIIRRFCHHLRGSLLFQCNGENVWHNKHSQHFLDAGAQAFVTFTACCTLPVAATWAQSSMKQSSDGETSTPFQRHFETDRPMFEVFHGDKQWTCLFNTVMTYFSGQGRLSVEGIAKLFDWNSLGRVTVVDVGGNQGDCVQLLASMYPHLDLVVQDTSEVVCEALERQKERPSSLQERVKFEVHDFWQPQIRGADVFLLRLILHDYDDNAACTILNHLLEAVNPGGRILIMDMVFDLEDADLARHRRLSTMNCELKMMMSGGERSKRQWQALLLGSGCMGIEENLVQFHQRYDNDLSLIEIGPIYYDKM